MTDINLRPYREKQTQRILRNFKISMISAFIVSCVFMGVQYNAASESLSEVENDGNKVEQALNSIEAFNEAHDHVNAQKEKELEKIDLTYSLYNGKLNTAIVIDDFASVFPVDYGYLTRFEKNQNQYTLNGVVNEEKRFHQFLDKLSETKTLSAYNVKEIKKEKGNINFRIEIFEKFNN